MKLAIVGSRRRNTRKDKEIVRKKILELKPDAIVTSKKCQKGADKFARELAEELGIKLITKTAHINPKMAYYDMVKEYYRMNREIAKEGDKMLALPHNDRKGGTENAITEFKKLNSDKKCLIVQ